MTMWISCLLTCFEFSFSINKENFSECVVHFDSLNTRWVGVAEISKNVAPMSAIEICECRTSSDNSSL